MLANHKLAYRNQFYNSLYDTADNIHYEYHNGSDISNDSVQKYVGDVALMVARSVFGEITGQSYDGKVVANLTVVSTDTETY